MPNNYKKQLVKFDMTKIMSLSLKMLIAPIIIGAICVFTYFDKISFKLIHILYFILAYIVLIFAHELFHALGYLMTGGKIKGIDFGINLKQGILYCHCKEAMIAKKYIVVLILPLIITGILPFIMGLIFKNLFFTLIGAFLISGASGDVLMLKEVKKYSKDQLILDHFKAPAYYLCYKEEDLPSDFKEVTVEEEETLIREMNTSIYKKDKTDKKKKISFLKIFIFSCLIGAILGIIYALYF